MNVPEDKNNTAKMRFCSRFHNVLHLTCEKKEQISQVGAAWYPDGIHFICNSRILGNYMNIKPNTINKNFRNLSFEKIERITSKDIMKIFGNLPDIDNWKVRKNTKYNFTRESSHNDVDQIHYSEKTAYDSYLANPQNHQVENLMSKVYSYQNSFKNEFIQRATKDWHIICNYYNYNQQIESINRADFIKTIINFAEPKITQNVETIESNLETLIKKESGFSQQLPRITFFDYLQLCLRFGLVKQIANTIAELSSASSHSFAPWFIPSNDNDYAEYCMSNENLDWCLKLSKTYPNAYSLLVKNGINQINAHYIIFNPIPQKPEETLLIKDDHNSTIIYGLNFHSIIQESLHLQIPENDIQRHETKSVVYVPINNIINRNQPNNQNESENQQSSFDELFSTFDNFEYQDDSEVINDSETESFFL